MRGLILENIFIRFLAFGGLIHKFLEICKLIRLGFTKTFSLWE